MDDIVKLNIMLNSVKEVIISKDIEINNLKEFNTILENEKRQWTQMRIVQDDIIQNTLNKANILNNQYLEEIQTLRTEIYELKNGDFN